MGATARDGGGGAMGTTDAGVSRSGKWEMSGVPGGGRMRENSGAREVSGVCFLEERARRRFVPWPRSSTRVCGVMSGA